MANNEFKTATLQDFKEACADKDAEYALSILTEDFNDNIDSQKSYNFSPAIVQTLGNLARDDENNDFLRDFLNMADIEFTDIHDLHTDIHDLHIAIRNGANEIEDNQDIVLFINDALSNMSVDSKMTRNPTIDDGYYMGDGSDLVGIDDDPEGSCSDLDFNHM